MPRYTAQVAFEKDPSPLPIDIHIFANRDQALRLFRVMVDKSPAMIGGTLYSPDGSILAAVSNPKPKD